LGEEIVNASLTSNGGGGQGIVASDHHGADAHGAEMIETLLHSAFDDVGQCDDAEDAAVFGDEQGSSASVGDIGDGLLHRVGDFVAALGDVFRDRVGRALADLCSVEIDAGHARLRGEGNERRIEIAEFAAAEPVLFFYENDDGAAFGSF